MGVDAGGLYRDWLGRVAREVFDVKLGESVVASSFHLLFGSGIADQSLWLQGFSLRRTRWMVCGICACRRPRQRWP
jgi:hypothetical protein